MAVTKNFISLGFSSKIKKLTYYLKKPINMFSIIQTNCLKCNRNTVLWPLTLGGLSLHKSRQENLVKACQNPSYVIQKKTH